eukprot:756732-Hanusia_phi.AAC.4
MERRNLLVVPAGKPLPEVLLPLLVLNSDWPRQVTEGPRVGQVDGGRGVVCQDPRHDGVLGQVVVRPASEVVEMHQILEVGDPPVHPIIRQSRASRVFPGVKQEMDLQRRAAGAD